MVTPESREALPHDMRMAQREAKDADPHHAAARRKGLLVRLSRLWPGSTVALRCITDAAGTVRTEPGADPSVDPAQTRRLVEAVTPERGLSG